MAWHHLALRACEGERDRNLDAPAKRSRPIRILAECAGSRVVEDAVPGALKHSNVGHLSSVVVDFHRDDSATTSARRVGRTRGTGARFRLLRAHVSHRRYEPQCNKKSQQWLHMQARHHLTRHKISDGGRERAWLQVECGSHGKLERGAARRSLHRLVRWWRGPQERRGIRIWNDKKHRMHQRHGNRTLGKNEAKQPTRGRRGHGTGSPYSSRAAAARETCNSRTRLEPRSAQTTESDSKLTDE